MSSRRNSFWLGGQFLTSAILSFIAFKFNILNFGEQLFGAWLILYSIWSLGLGIDFGFGNTIIRFINSTRSKNSNDNASGIYSFSLTVISGMAIILTIIGIIVGAYFYLPNENLVPARFYDNLLYSFIILGFNFFLQYLSIAFKSTLEGFGYFVHTSRISIIYSITNFIFILLVYYLKFSIVYLSIGMLVSSSIYLSQLFLLKRMKIQSTRYNPMKAFIGSEIRSYIKFSFNLQISSILIALLDPIIKYLLGNYISLGSVAYFEISRRISTSLSGLYQVSFKYLLNKTSSLSSIEAKETFMLGAGKKISKIGATYSLVLYGAGIFFIYIVIMLWFNEIQIFFYLSLVLAGDALQPLTLTGYQYLMGIGKTAVLTLLHASQLLIISLSLLFTALLWGSPLGLLSFMPAIFLSTIIIYRISFSELKHGFNYLFDREIIAKVSFLTAVLLSLPFFTYYLNNRIILYLFFMSITFIAISYKEILWIAGIFVKNNTRV